MREREREREREKGREREKTILTSQQTIPLNTKRFQTKDGKEKAAEKNYFFFFVNESRFSSPYPSSPPPVPE